MKHTSIILGLGTLVFCCSIALTEVRAQTVSGYTSIDYDQDTSIVDAYSETDNDYDVEGAYHAWVALSVTDQDNSVMGYQNATDDGAMGFASVDIQFTGSADSTYTARGLHKLIAQQWDYDYSFWPTVTTIWYDYYDFSDFAAAGIQVPVFYAFQGTDSEVTRSSPQIILGTTYDDASVTTAGPPDHVKVLRDQQGEVCEGGLQVRQITVQIVDQGGQKITTQTSVAEGFSNLSANSCGNGSPSPWPCTATQRGTFIDSMAVSDHIHCDSAISRGSGCGYTLTSTWSVCSGSSHPAIWTYNGETRSNLVKVNNTTQIQKGTALYP